MEVMSGGYSIGINRGGWYWCANCGDIKGPCEHFPPLFQAASDLLEALENLVQAYRALYPDDVVSPSVAKAQAAIRKATEQAVKS
jgi:hypothetical protein